MATKYHKPVARAASLAAALALTIPLAPLAASAAKSPPGAAVRGTVIATNAARHTLVVSTGRAVDTVRFANAGAVATVALGSRVAMRASRLADGTFKERSMRVWGHARRTTIRAAVVSSSATQLVLSTGTSTLLVNRASAVATVAKSGRHSHASSSTLGVGAEVRVSLDIQPTGLDATSITDMGQSGFVGLEGTLASVTPANGTIPGSLVINVEAGATTTVTIPSSIAIPSTIAVNDAVELLTSFAGGTFTLVTITDDSIAANQASNGVSTDQNNAAYVEAEGLVTSYTAATSATVPGTLTVQPGDGVAAMTFSVPFNEPVSSTLQVGSRVHVTANVTGGTLTAVTIQVQQPEGEGNGSMTTQTEGMVIGLPTSGSSTLVVQPGDGRTSISFAVPAGMDVSSITSGAKIHVTGVFVNGVLTLQSFKIQQSDGGQGNGQPDSAHFDGVVVSDIAGQLVLLESDGAGTVTITVPSSLQALAATFVAGVHVTATATMQSNVLTLTNIVANN